MQLNIKIVNYDTIKSSSQVFFKVGRKIIDFGQNGRLFFPPPRNFFARLSIHKRLPYGHRTHQGLALAIKIKDFRRVDFSLAGAQN